MHAVLSFHKKIVKVMDGLLESLLPASEHLLIVALLEKEKKTFKVTYKDSLAKYPSKLVGISQMSSFYTGPDLQSSVLLCQRGLHLWNRPYWKRNSTL